MYIVNAVAPKIDHGGMRDVKCKVAQSFQFNVSFEAEPMPEVTWSKDGIPVALSDR